MKRLLLVLALLSGCAAPPAPQPPAALPAAAPETADSWYLRAAGAGRQVYRIDAARSLIAVTVRRGGPLARLGHDHVVASHGVTGFAAPADNRADFRFRLDQMTVDEPGLRKEAALDTQPSPSAIEGTRTNMLKVLDAARFPVVALHAERLAGSAGTVRLSITLHGVTRTVDVPVRGESSAASIEASGTLALRQSDFGITPMSVMGGAMSVLDTLELRFRIVALPLSN